jgi:hypothetical protein
MDMRRIEIPLRRDTNRKDHFDQPPLRTVDNTDFLASALGKSRVHYRSRTDITVVDGRELPVAASLLVSNAHQCFDGHVGIRLTPSLIMNTIVRELAREIQRKPEHYRRLVASHSGRTIIRIKDDLLSYREPGDPASWWDLTIGIFREPIRAAIAPETASLFVPNFASATEEDKLVILLGLMDAASPYYDYAARTQCGIPVVELDGPASDWHLLAQRVEQLARYFPALAGYFRGLVPVLDKIAATASGRSVDDEFWRSFYKYNAASGNTHVTGWITSLFAFEQTPKGSRPKDNFNWRSGLGTKLAAFPSGISAVPFIWEVRVGKHAGDIPMHFVSGALGIDQTDTDTLETRLGFAVAQA